MMDLDIRYVEGKSPLLDLKILALTFPAIIAQVRDTRRSRK